MTKNKNWAFRFKFWMLLILTLPLSGCFEIIHELNLNPNGTGRVEFVINFSRSAIRIELLKLLDDVNGHQIPSDSEIRRKINNFTDSVRVSPGITNVFSRYDEKNYILEFGCDFDRVERVNDRIFDLWLQNDPSKAVREKYYSYAENELKVNLGSRILALFQQMKPVDREVLVGADYTSILRFNNEVISQTNKVAKIIPNKKIIIVQSPILSLIQEPSLFNNIIKVKL